MALNRLSKQNCCLKHNKKGIKRCVFLNHRDWIRSRSMHVYNEACLLGNNSLVNLCYTIQWSELLGFSAQKRWICKLLSSLGQLQKRIWRAKRRVLAWYDNFKFLKITFTIICKTTNLFCLSSVFSLFFFFVLLFF